MWYRRAGRRNGSAHLRRRRRLHIMGRCMRRPRVRSWQRKPGTRDKGAARRRPTASAKLAIAPVTEGVIVIFTQGTQPVPGRRNYPLRRMVFARQSDSNRALFRGFVINVATLEWNTDRYVWPICVSRGVRAPVVRRTCRRRSRHESITWNNNLRRHGNALGPRRERRR